MMRFIATYDNDGKYLEFGNEGLGFPKSGDMFYVGKVDIDNQYHDLASDTPVNMPPRPSRSHNFNYASKQWVPDLNLAWTLVRMKRQELLSSCDWMVTKSSETGVALTEAWTNYRQALRDITNQQDPLNVTWPTEPI